MCTIQRLSIPLVVHGIALGITLDPELKPTPKFGPDVKLQCIVSSVGTGTSIGLLVQKVISVGVHLLAHCMVLDVVQSIPFMCPMDGGATPRNDPGPLS